MTARTEWRPKVVEFDSEQHNMDYVGLEIEDCALRHSFVDDLPEVVISCVRIA